MKKTAVILAAALLAGLLFLAAPAVAAKNLSQKAPEWQVSEWINSPALSLADLRGRVVIIEFFQLWCPGCNSFSIPLMKYWAKKYAQEIKEGKLALVSIHTVFEGHSFQTPAKLREFVKEKGMHHPVGVDRQLKNSRLPETMKAFRTGGTPEMAIIDKQGYIRFQHFGGFNPRTGEKLIDQLLAE